MKIACITVYRPIAILLLILLIPFVLNAQKEETKAEILSHGAIIRKAFADGDLEKIKALHHPKVSKALGYNNLKIGREAVMEGIAATLENFDLEFIENEVESILIQDQIAIEQTRFSIQGMSKNGGDSFVFRGRTMVSYVKYDQSPTGWATIREIIQVATD